MKNNQQLILVLATLVAVIALRLVPHLPNFSPLCAIALFGAAHFRNRWLAYTLPLVAIVVSDILVNNILYPQYFNGFTVFYEGCWWQYAAYGVIVLAATAWFQRGVGAATVLGGAFGASLIFFLISNFGVWAGSAMYPQNATGLLACYAAGLPFLQTTLASDVLFSGVLFGAFALIQRLAQRVAVA